MRAGRLIWLVLVLLGCIRAQDAEGTITGVVEDAVSHSPIAKAKVTLTGRIGQAEGSPSIVTTDASGNYRFEHLAAATYMLRVTHRAYPPLGRAVERRVTLRGAESVRAPAIELVPPAAVSGRVVDEDGDPLSGCTPALIPEFRRSGGGGQRPVPGSEGTYRLEGIRPGRYYVLLQCQAQPFQARPLLPEDARLPVWVYPPQFYPSSTDGSGAQLLSLAAGSELSGVDFQAKPVRAYRVEGTVETGPSAGDGGRLVVGVLPQNPLLSRSLGFLQAEVDAATGVFSLPGLAPGSYRLLAMHSMNGKSDSAATEHVEVIDRPVRVNIALRPAFNLEGQVEWAGDPGAGSKAGTVYLVSAETSLPIPIRRVHFDAGGRFRLEDIVAGRWRLNVDVPNGFVRSIRMPDREVTGGLLDLTGGPPSGPLRIEISTRLASVEVTAPPESLVTVISLDEQYFVGTRTYPADEQGRVLARELPPGTYRISAKDPLLDQGKEITVKEGETATMDLRTKE